MTKELWLTSNADGDLELWTHEPIREQNYWRNDRGEYLPTTETETLLFDMLGFSQPLQPMQCVKVRFEIINNQPTDEELRSMFDEK